MGVTEAATILTNMPGHAPVAHDFKAFSQTGHVRHCFRCEYLQGYKRALKRAQKYK